MADEFGPWIEHDGFTPMIPVPPGGRVVIEYAAQAGGLLPDCVRGCGPDWPGFYWRWVRVRTGWLRSELRRVCDDPAYAPILSYRVKRPFAMARLEAIAARPRAAVIG